MQGVFQEMDNCRDINEPDLRQMVLWIQWQKSSDELDLDDFTKTDSAERRFGEDVLQKSALGSSASAWVTL
jgi:hypothetical protein